MSTQSIHRASRTKPNPCATVIIDYCGLTVLACDRQTVAVNYGPETLTVVLPIQFAGFPSYHPCKSEAA